MIELANRIQIAIELCRNVVLLPNAGNALLVFAGFFRPLMGQIVTTHTRVSIMVDKRFLFLLQRIEDQALYYVLEHICMIACMETVSVT
ncbi:Uncharacterised protein [Vibrio cholerae]|nr:Uncharacterised protein [Vibrio cholerae]CSB91459.1 Uncharacterised protein [Vibrio cholerae]CSB95891.1 Uncharacterised protein [Vibrio cholerae]